MNDSLLNLLEAKLNFKYINKAGSQKPKAYEVIFEAANGMFHKTELANNAMNEVICLLEQWVARNC